MVLTHALARLALRHRRAWTVLRWSAMAAAIFWTLVYRLGFETRLPEFVYVNF